MIKFCREYGIKFLVYGILGGGFILERYLNKKELVKRVELYIAFFVKYK